VRAAVEADPATRTLVAAAAAAGKRSIDLERAVEVVERMEAVPDDLKNWRSEHDWPELALATKWEGAVTALHRDADAALPDVE
jgi:hypothetical protein